MGEGRLATFSNVALLEISPNEDPSGRRGRLVYADADADDDHDVRKQYYA